MNRLAALFLGIMLAVFLAAGCRTVGAAPAEPARRKARTHFSKKFWKNRKEFLAL
ncbi:MAG TPA: hypothetical protein VMW83_12675 [Spirochaetia bacterium]|nr:hypothetical protein [Spirochaetia bacterium]